MVTDSYQRIHKPSGELQHVTDSYLSLVEIRSPGNTYCDRFLPKRNGDPQQVTDSYLSLVEICSI